VISQDPKGNTKAEKGSNVELTVSGGVGKVAVPKVTGITQAAATTLLQTNSLVANAEPEASDTVAQGQVISQDPAAGTQAAKGSVVTIKVSSGVAPVVVPDVVGDDATSASNQLGQAGLKTQTTQQSSETVAQGRIISQTPAAGTQLAKGSTVNLVVSSGPPPTTSTSTTTSTTSSSTTTIAPH
jgi:serine/threonine-protein kinase